MADGAAHRTARRSGDRGTATAELAVALPAVVIAMSAVMGVGQAVLAELSCVDAARAGARAAARGDEDARVESVARQAAGSTSTAVTVSRGALVRVTVLRRVRLLVRGPTLTATASAVAEPEQPGDGGSACVLVLAAVMLATVLAGAAGSVGAAVLARHRAQAASDLAALAGAGAAQQGGPSAACAAARRVATANAASLSDCRVVGPRVLVRVAVRPPAPVSRLGDARATALAGPSGQGSR